MNKITLEAGILVDRIELAGLGLAAVLEDLQVVSGVVGHGV